VIKLGEEMSYLENLNPKHALESLGLRREPPNVMMELVLPGIALFVLGACVGAGVALLLAPQTGRQLRHDISDKAGELATSARKALPSIDRADAGETVDDGHYRPEKT
jgi:hypothetical protein